MGFVNLSLSLHKQIAIFYRLPTFSKSKGPDSLIHSFPEFFLKSYVSIEILILSEKKYSDLTRVLNFNNCAALSNCGGNLILHA